MMAAQCKFCIYTTELFIPSPPAARLRPGMLITYAVTVPCKISIIV